MKEYHYGRISMHQANTILNEWAADDWAVQWINRNDNSQLIDVLLVREAR